MEIKIDLENALPLYKAGQYAEISVENISAPRSYSFACAPDHENSGSAVFYVRHVPQWRNELMVACRVPNRHPCIVERPPMEHFFCAHQIHRLYVSPVVVVWRQLKRCLNRWFVTKLAVRLGFCLARAPRRICIALRKLTRFKMDYKGSFEFLPILSEEPGDSDWSGLRGLVTEYIADASNDLVDSQAYLCGPPPMIDSAIEVLTSKGVSNEQIFFDKFLDASHSPRN